MAIQANQIGRAATALPFDPAVALAMIPSLPRPVLSRLVTRMIERMDEIDGDPDFEPDCDLEPEDAI